MGIPAKWQPWSCILPCNKRWGGPRLAAPRHRAMHAVHATCAAPAAPWSMARCYRRATAESLQPCSCCRGSLQKFDRDGNWQWTAGSGTVTGSGTGEVGSSAMAGSAGSEPATSSFCRGFARPAAQCRPAPHAACHTARWLPPDRQPLHCPFLAVQYARWLRLRG